MITFRVEGPHKVPMLKGARGRVIDKDSRKEFCRDHSETGVGCYVFCLRFGKGIIPIYVGQAKNDLAQECLADHKLTIYNSVLTKHRGSPLMFFVVKNGGSTAEFERCLHRVEHHLIQLASEKNSELANIQRVSYRIEGIFKSSQRGKHTEAARWFRKALGL